MPTSFSHLVGIDEPEGHPCGILRPDFEVAVRYLGGALFETEYGEVILSFSPRATKRLGVPQTCRYLSYAAIPSDLVERLFEAWETALDEQQDRDLRDHPCRPCRTAGRMTVATVECFGLRAMCQACADVLLPRLAIIPAPKAPLPMEGRACKGCDQQLFHVDNVWEQIRLVGRFTSLCPECWRKRTRHGFDPASL